MNGTIFFTRNYLKKTHISSVLLLMLYAFITGCGGATKDHFTQSKPSIPDVEVTDADTDKLVVALSNPQKVHEYVVYWSDNEDMQDADKIILAGEVTEFEVAEILSDVIGDADKLYISITAVWEGKESERSEVIVFVVSTTPPDTNATNNETQVSDTAPSISLIGGSSITVVQGESFDDPGAKASDKEDGNISAYIEVFGNVNTNQTGDYTLTYLVKDSTNKTAVVQRTVVVIPPWICTAPESITVEATGPLTNVASEILGVATATGFDETSLVISHDFPAEGLAAGSHTVTWICSDDSGHVSSASQVVVIQDTTPPNISAPDDPLPVHASPGVSTMPVAVGSATALDLVSDAGSITIDHAPKSPYPLGETMVTWTATDAAGNSNSAIQIVKVLPAQIQNLSVSEVTTSSLKLSWENIVGATSYTVYWTSQDQHGQLPNPGDGTTQFSVTSNNYFVHSGLSDNSQYHYLVAANNEAGQGATSSLLSKLTLPILPDLVARYSFNGNAQDDSGNSLHGSVSGAVLTTDRFGNSNSAYSFNGINSDIHVSHDPLFDITQEISLAAWIYPTEQKTQHIVRLGAGVNGSTASPYGLSTSATGDIILSLRPNGVFTQLRQTGYTLNQWTFVVGTYDGATMKLYVNGELVKSLNVFGTLNTNNDPLLIGTRLNLQADTFKGKLDDIAIYSKVLTATEVNELYTPATPVAAPVLHLPFDGNANDVSGNGLHGIVNGATLTSDRNGATNKAYSFNGVNSDIHVPYDPLFNITKQITLAAWIYPTATKSQDIILDGAAVNGTTAAPYGLGLSGTGDVIFEARPNLVFTQVRKTGYSLNTWTHVAGTYDGSSMKLYINGEMVASTAISGDLNTTTNPLLIGTRLNLPADTFQGKLDEIRIFNTALSATQIMNLVGQ